jgi:hypothetical protein
MMEIGNKDTQYNVSKKNHTTITQRYKCLLHVKFGNQPYPDYINVYYMLSLVISHTTYHVVDNIPSQSFDKVVTYKVRNHLKGHFPCEIHAFT